MAALDQRRDRRRWLAGCGLAALYSLPEHGGDLVSQNRAVGIEPDLVRLAVWHRDSSEGRGEECTILVAHSLPDVSPIMSYAVPVMPGVGVR